MPRPAERASTAQRASALTLLAAALLLPRLGHAQDPGVPPAPATTSPAPGQTEGDSSVNAPEPESDTGKKKKKKKDKGDEGDKQDGPPPLEFSGRVFALAGQRETQFGMTSIPARFIELQSARFGLKYEVLDGISLNIELDAAGPEVKDAYVQAKSKHLRGRAGHFKMPLSSITLESPWSLPVVDRGLIQDLLTHKMMVLGRRAGVLGGVRAKGALDPELSIGAFQGSQISAKGKVEPLAALQNDSYDSYTVFARATVTPAGNEVGLVGGRVSTRGGGDFKVRHFWVAGLDATVDVPFGGHGLRAWVEGLYGTTAYPLAAMTPGDPPTHPEATYWSGRGILAWRYGGMAAGDGYIEPFVQYGMLDPTADANLAGRVTELAAGIGAGYWRRARLTLQFTMDTSDDKETLPTGLFFGDAVVTDNKALFLQAGAAF